MPEISGSISKKNMPKQYEFLKNILNQFHKKKPNEIFKNDACVREISTMINDIFLFVSNFAFALFWSLIMRMQNMRPIKGLFAS